MTGRGPIDTFRAFEALGIKHGGDGEISDPIDDHPPTALPPILLLLLLDEE